MKDTALRYLWRCPVSYETNAQKHTSFATYKRDKLCNSAKLASINPGNIDSKHRF